MNKVILMGRLTKDPEIRYTPTQKVVAQFTLAVDRPFLDKQGQRVADFIPVVVWGKGAEMIGNSCAKGHRLLVEGRLQIRSYEDNTATRRWVTEIIASGFQFIEKKQGARNDNGAQGMADIGQEVPFDEEVPF